MKFVKMHGLGNDYVFADTFTQPEPRDPAALAVEVARPHVGIGSDGLILIGPAQGADARMRIFNADGSEAQICGNGLRCVAKYLYDAGLCRREEMDILTGAGVRHVSLIMRDGEATAARADMGEPRLIAVRKALEVEGRTLRFTCVSMGNPHAVTFDEAAEDEAFYRLGPAVENHDAFQPDRTNAEFVRAGEDGALHVRVWERGSGETMACGSGACASLVTAVAEGRCARRARVVLPGGALEIEWSGENNRVFMTGPVQRVFSGEYPVK